MTEILQSGVASCVGSAPSGTNADTLSVGVRPFVVNATDNVGNAAKQALTYSVTYRICALYDQTKNAQSGSTIPIKLQLCDAKGNNVSSSGIVVTAQSVTLVSSTISGGVQDAGNANPDSKFRFDSTLGGTGGYIYNLSTKGFSAGRYYLTLAVSADPLTHTIGFQLK